MLCGKQMQQSNAPQKQATNAISTVSLTSRLTRVSYSQNLALIPSAVAPRLRAPECPMFQPRDQVFWNMAQLDTELNNILL